MASASRLCTCRIRQRRCLRREDGEMPFTIGHEVGGWVEEWGAGIEGLKKASLLHSCNFSLLWRLPRVRRPVMTTYAARAVGVG